MEGAGSGSFSPRRLETKAQEAAVRLGGSIAEGAPQSATPGSPDFALTPPEIPVNPPSEPELPFEHRAEVSQSERAPTEMSPAGVPATLEARKRRRGRRGGRNRGKAGARIEPPAPPSQPTQQASAPHAELPPPVLHQLAQPNPPPPPARPTLPPSPLPPPPQP